MSQLITLYPSVFSFTHMYVTLALLESSLNEGGLELGNGTPLDELNAIQIKELFGQYVRANGLEVCYANSQF